MEYQRGKINEISTRFGILCSAECQFYTDVSAQYTDPILKVQAA
jgi:hypothetical protein